MVEGRATLIIDLGNSETRNTTCFGKTKSGLPRKRVSVFSNKFGELLDEGLLENPDYSPNNSKVFKVDGNIMMCTGKMCNREKGTASQRPSATIKKYDSNISMYSIRKAFMQAYSDIADITHSRPESLNIRWDVFVLLPPSDMDLGKDRIIERVKSLREIDFLMPKFSKPLVIDSVRVLPEGFCAFIGAVFKSPSEIREGYEKYLEGSTLIVDIGSGTTDVVIISNTELVDSSRYSENTGGNQVFQKLNMAIRREMGINVPEDTLRKTAVSGVLNIGSRSINVKESVENAKKDVAVKLSQSLKNYIESSEFSPFDIQYIFVCGGGSEPCEDGMKSLGDYLKDNLKDWMKYSEFIEPPVLDTKVQYSDEDGDSEDQVASVRLLNVIGAEILSELR